MKLVIDRSRWLRGEGDDRSLLLRERDSKMCCLGFYSLALGFDEEDIREYASPDEVDGEVEYPEWMYRDDGHCDMLSRDVVDLMVVNDAKSIWDPDRERSITSIFARNGVEVEFVGER